MKRLLILLLLSVSIYSLCKSQQAEYDQLKAKIEAEEDEPHSGDGVSKDFDEYLMWLDIKAVDRDRARDLASKYSMEGNPYWAEQFLNLMELAQDSGESTLWMADYLFLRIKTKLNGIAGDDWLDAVFKADYYGKRLFQKAGELSFDANYIRESVRCLMRFALGKVETGYTGLYYGRVLRHGTQFDSEGNLVMPDMDFDINCLPRSAFHLESEGSQAVAVDKGLSNVEKIREVCQWFDLFEYNDGTDLMNGFLQDFLCDDKFNSNNSLQWYLTQARKYNLKKSEDYILGYYGTVYGKVEVQEGEQLKTAPGAQVQIIDAPNTLEAKADGNGKYSIEKAPLHCKCPPYPISAEFDGDRTDSKYKGILKEPDPAGEQKKDLVIEGSDYAWTGTLDLEVVERFNCQLDEKTSELGYRVVNGGDEKRTVVRLSFGLDDFDLPGQAINVGAKIQYLSGEMSLNMVEDHYYKGYAEKTECFNKGTGKHEWVSPGNWNSRHETKSAQAYHDLEKGMFTLLIIKEEVASMDESAMQKLQMQMQEAAQKMDLPEIERLKGEMLKMVQGDQESKVISVRIRIDINPGMVQAPVYTSSDRKVYNVCKGDYEVNEVNTETLEAPLLLPVGIEMYGTYLRDDNGRDVVKATLKESEEGQPNFYSDICPKTIISINGELTIERNKNQNNKP